MVQKRAGRGMLARVGRAFRELVGTGVGTTTVGEALEDDGPLMFGVYPAVVTDIRDPQELARVRVRLVRSDLETPDLATWAPVVALGAADNAGAWWLPAANDAVLVAFEGGRLGAPYVVGSLWNNDHIPPEVAGAGEAPAKRMLRTPEGVAITFSDAPGQASLELATPGGQKVTLKDWPGGVAIADANGNQVRMEPAGVTVDASAKVTINCGTAEVNAGMLSVNAGMSKFSGVVQCDTLIAESVVGSSYTPGAGNIW